jgi:hypothetical protein
VAAPGKFPGEIPRRPRLADGGKAEIHRSFVFAILAQPARFFLQAAFTP